MALNLRIHQENMTTGHDIYCSIPVRWLAINPPTWPVINCFCYTLPTTWHLALAYEQEADYGKVCCGFFLRRADSLNGSIYVNVSVGYLDSSGATVIYPRSLCHAQMSSGQIMRGALEETRFPGYISYIYNLQLILQLSIEIRNCHTVSKIWDPPSSICNEKTKWLSKL